MDLSSGQNVALSGSTIRVEVDGALDLTALVLNENGQVSTDEDMIFFNAPSAPGARLEGSTLTVTLDLLRAGADKVALVASPATEGVTFASLPSPAITVTHGSHRARFSPTPEGSETALVLCELYRRQGAWKLRALGQGFANGLAGVATEYGIDITEDPAPPVPLPTQAPTPAPAPAPAPASQAPRVPQIDLTKVPVGQISLTKSSSAKIPLVKGDKGSLKLSASLRWDGRGRGKSDLDLYALYIDDSGSEQVVYYKDRGSLTKPPFMKLDKDSRDAGEENITLVAGHHKYVLFCAYSALSNGAGSFFDFKARVVVDDAAGSQITVPLFSKKKFSYWVAIALLDFTDPTGISVQQIEQYGKNFSERRPVLNADGSFVMSTGKIEFKGRKNK